MTDDIMLRDCADCGLTFDSRYGASFGPRRRDWRCSGCIDTVDTRVSAPACGSTETHRAHVFALGRMCVGWPVEPTADTEWHEDEDAAS